MLSREQVQAGERLASFQRCHTAEEYFAVLDIGYEPGVLEVNRLPILRAFAREVARINRPPADRAHPAQEGPYLPPRMDPVSRIGLYRDALRRSYAGFAGRASGDPVTGRVTAEPVAGRDGGPAPGVTARIADHPCYSQDAHQYYARMHVPVAPGCNLQCHYCNRKYDCSNESRPGVTSALLTPEQALARVMRVANRVRQLRVVGVAGPGEPLANARRTFRTLELVRRHCPDLRLCLSTNGLTLADHVDRIVELGIEHVTITINMTDPEVGARIYPWIGYRGRRYTGAAAARILSERQLEGLRALVERNILCKVNSVLIPGVNDAHLVAVSRTVRQLGAFVHNVMPLVARAEHGTHFGLTGQREPTLAELWALRQRCEDAAGAGMAVMRHCRQCRADAVGMLGEDLGGDATGPGRDPGAQTGHDSDVEIGYDLEGRRQAHAAIEQWRAEVVAARTASGITTGGPAVTTRVAVATTGGGVVNQHFGRAREFWVYEAAAGWVRFLGVRRVPGRCGGADTCGEPSASLEAAVGLLADCSAVLCSKIGPQPHGALVRAGIEPIEAHDLIEQAVAEAGARLVATAQGGSVREVRR